MRCEILTSMQADVQPLTPGGVAAKTLARVWSGAAGTLVSAAPGAGKTALVVDVLTHLVLRAGLRVAVATPTREQAYAITCRLHAVFGKGWVQAPISGAEDRLPHQVWADTRELDPRRRGEGSVTVRTIEAYRYRVNDDCDVMVVDEGYQSTFASLASAAAGAPQLLVVGDSGQIGPVVSEDVTVLEQWGVSPHLRAPDVLAQRADFETLHLGTTYRLGPDTTDIVGLLYPFPLTSGRPLRQLADGDEVLPEVTSLCVDGLSDFNDLDMLSMVAKRAAWLATLRRYDGELDQWTPMTDDDVAVVVSRNSQVSLVRGMVDALGHGDITVGTANKLQGGQWSAVVTIDPLAGVATPGERDVTTGLLCVMISRHTTHLTWVHTPQVELDDPLGLSVRAALAAHDEDR